MTRRMIARHDKYDVSAGVVDFIPTPPWATRALMEYVIPRWPRRAGHSVLEPSCGAGHISRTLKEYGLKVSSRDLVDHGYRCRKADFLEATDAHEFDYVITNPPYALCDQFYYKAEAAQRGIALLCRIQFVGSMKRFNGIFNKRPPTKIAVFSKRVPMRANRIVQNAASYFDHAWFWWDFSKLARNTELTWIPPEAQKLLEKPKDYE